MKRLLLVFCLFFSLPLLVEAQFSGLNTSASLDATPQFPEPFEEVTVSINAAGIDTTAATITWTIDGVEQVSARNQRSLTVTAGALGTSQRINATIRGGNGGSVPLSLTLRPSTVHLYLEADTIVPAFYKGRPVPSSGSLVRALALVELGSNIRPETLSYKWQLNNTVLRGGAVRGLSSVEFIMPEGGGATLYVDVFDTSGTLVGQTALQLPRVTPEILFYENNPLRGINPLAISDDFLMLGEEITFRAEPYFMSRSVLSGNSLIEWQVSGRKIDNPSRDQQELTLQQQGETGRFSIGFHIRNLSDLLQGAKESFTLHF